MRILLADKLSEACLTLLTAGGHEVFSQPELTGSKLTEALGEIKPSVLVVRSTKVPAEAIEKDSDLELIVRAGAGYDTIDVSAASRNGIFVANCPGKNAAAVAELTMGLILALDRSIPDNVIDAREGKWNKAKYGRATGIKGRTLGVIGLGSIGKEVVRLARAFDMQVVAWSRSLTEERADSLGIVRMNSPIDVAKSADAITLHVAATPDTEQLADRAFFEAMKPGAFFVNTTRSTVVDEDALVDAMETKGVRAALDVFSNEPTAKEGAFSHTLVNQSGLYITHHVGASTLQAQEAIAEEAVRVILTYAEFNVVSNCVNIAEQTPAVHQMTVRHLNNVGVLALVLNEISKAGWNVQEMENLIFADAQAACAVIRFDGTVREDVLQRIQANSDVLTVSVIDL